jgi:hypothetical protein
MKIANDHPEWRPDILTTLSDALRLFFDDDVPLEKTLIHEDDFGPLGHAQRTAHAVEREASSPAERKALGKAVAGALDPFPDA